MPYLDCPNCRLTVYSAASWAPIEMCPRCGERLGGPARLFRAVREARRAVQPATRKERP